MRRAATAADEQLQDPDAAEGAPGEAQDAPEEDAARHVPTPDEQSNLDAIADGAVGATTLAAIEHAKDDPGLKTPKASLPAADGTPRVMSAKVIDNAIVYVRVGAATLVLTSDEALALHGAIGAVAVELVR